MSRSTKLLGISAITFGLSFVIPTCSNVLQTIASISFIWGIIGVLDED